MTKKILITGALGQVGKTAALFFEEQGWDVYSYDVDTLDITNANALQNIFSEISPDILFNCAAYTAVDLAEDEPQKAELINTTAVTNLISACNNSDTLLIHISTDYVFDGKKKSPYTENDTPSPLSVYGETKAKADKLIQESARNWLIVRTGWVYSCYGKNFLKTMLQLGQSDTKLSVVDDQLGSPTSAGQIVATVAKLIKKSKQGLYNVTAVGTTSWYGFAKAIFSKASLSPTLTPCTSSQYPQKAKRPPYSVLSKTKLTSEGITTSSWQEALTIEIEKLQMEHTS